MKTSQILRLRNKETLNLFDRTNKLFVKIQLNKTTKFICWQRFTSKDKNNWVKQNESLRLKDVLNILETYKSKHTVN